VALQGRHAAGPVFGVERGLGCQGGAAGRGGADYGSVQGGGAVIRTSTASGTALTAKTTFNAEHWPGGVPALQRHFRASMAWRLCLVAEGAFDAMLTLRPSWEWDIAAGSLIASCAGALVTDRTGGPLHFNAADPRSHGVVVAAPGLHQDLISRLNK
jgi:myo-inositol-1(or 4)-monophosphatase